jgi:glycosyltransferase involved in cell wall biosynthesis
MKVWYVGLEPYVSRYTLQLKDWTIAEFNRLGVEYVDVPGKFPDSIHRQDHIKIGQALDAHVRPYFAMSQIQYLVESLYCGTVRRDDWIYFEDMFHPGIESLFYVLSFMPQKNRPRIGMKNQAQTIDPDDFTNYTGMAPWMREYEQMVLNGIDCLFINSPEMINFAVAAGWREKVDMALVGHFVHPQMVRDLLSEPLIQWKRREDKVIFASRLVPEKQPRFFIEVAKKLWEDSKFSRVKFDILSGVSLSTSPYAVELTEWARIDSRVSIKENLSKVDYYKVLNRSKVMFNCAFQDWISYVLLEASSLGMNVLFPAYRSFPPTLDSNPDLLFIPWSVDDAVAKLKKLLLNYNSGSEFPSKANFKAVENTVDVMDSYVNTVTRLRSKFILPKTTKHKSGEQYAIS